jgi:hypothetical protein
MKLKDTIHTAKHYGEVTYRFTIKGVVCFRFLKGVLFLDTINCEIKDKGRLIYWTGNVGVCHLVADNSTCAITVTINSLSAS